MQSFLLVSCPFLLVNTQPHRRIRYVCGPSWLPSHNVNHSPDVVVVVVVVVVTTSVMCSNSPTFVVVVVVVVVIVVTVLTVSAVSYKQGSTVSNTGLLFTVICWRNVLRHLQADMNLVQMVAISAWRCKQQVPLKQQNTLHNIMLYKNPEDHQMMNNCYKETWKCTQGLLGGVTTVNNTIHVRVCLTNVLL